MVAIIRGSRQTVNQRYEMHAEQKRQQALANMPPPGGSVFIVPGCQCHGMYGGYNMGAMPGMNFGCGGMPGMGFGGPPHGGGMPNWFTSFLTGSAIGKGLMNIGMKLFGNNNQV